jgi:hypothetical protein
MQRNVYEVKCTSCNQTATVPFKPTPSSQFTAENALPNTQLGNPQRQIQTILLNRNRRGHGGDSPKSYSSNLSLYVEWE